MVIHYTRKKKTDEKVSTSILETLEELIRLNDVEKYFKHFQKATEMLISLITSKRPVTEFQTVVLPTQLFVRKSSIKKS